MLYLCCTKIKKPTRKSRLNSFVLEAAPKLRGNPITVLVLEAGVLQISRLPLTIGFPDVPIWSVPELDTFNIKLIFRNIRSA